jgi:hypothetical protein
MWKEEKLVPVKYSKRTYNDDNDDNTDFVIAILGINSQIDAMTLSQKYYGELIPIKAKKLGLFGITGGGGLQSIERDENGKTINFTYNSYVDELVDTRSNYETGTVLEMYFNKFKKMFEKRDIKIDQRELQNIEDNINKLKKDEVKLINISSIIEKYFALRQYYEGDDFKTDPTSIKQITALVLKHKEKLTRVEKRRSGMGKMLYVMANTF